MPVTQKDMANWIRNRSATLRVEQGYAPLAAIRKAWEEWNERLGDRRTT